MSSRSAALPLSVLLSQTLVAFIIEFDNEFEHRMPHRTTNYGKASSRHHALWLTSMEMWSTCLAYVDEAGITVAELKRRARTDTNLDGMRRWGYITLAPSPSDPRPKPPLADWVIHATSAGQEAQSTWRPLFGMIEVRWRERFGNDAVDHLRDALIALVSQFGVMQPDCLPILHSGSGLTSSPSIKSDAPPTASLADLPLPALLSKVLLAFAVLFERNVKVGLALCANILRILNENGTPIRDLPGLTGVSKESISMATGFLARHGYAITEPAPKRGKMIRLTDQGRELQANYVRELERIESRWREGFGVETVERVRQALELLVGGATAETSPLFRGLEPYPDNWRAQVRKPNLLPYFPMVLHRGGYPDGS